MILPLRVRMCVAFLMEHNVARYYGYGETERSLGAFIRSRRAQVTVTTKFGVEPTRRQQHASILVKGNAFSVADAYRNLETSLRELGTDDIDFYLLLGLGTSIDSVMRSTRLWAEPVWSHSLASIAACRHSSRPITTG